MKFTVLVDNNTLTDRYFYAEPGVSYFIEAEGKRILFDTGYSDIFLKNAWKMNIDLRNLDYIALSHGHIDHTWGLEGLLRLYFESAIENISYKKPQLIAHPLAFQSKIIGNLPEIGSVISDEKLSRHLSLNMTREPFWITEKLVFLGQIERKLGFEGKNTVGDVIKPDSKEPDPVLDDTALAYKSDQGLVIIAGCSHCGICNIIEYTRKICTEERVAVIIGGLHLLNPEPKQLQETLKYIKSLNLKALYACHCTDLDSKVALSTSAPLKEVGVGLKLDL